MRTPDRERDIASLGYIAVPRRADPLQLHLSGLPTPAGPSVTASGHLACMLDRPCAGNTNSGGCIIELNTVSLRLTTLKY
jgi:hypothetical protein